MTPASTEIPPAAGPYKIPMKQPTRRYYRKDDAGPDSPRPEREQKVRRRHITYESPRCTIEDEQLFPRDHSIYSTDTRWKHISEQAGTHRQDGTVLTISRHMTPSALKNGMTTQAAQRVRCLNLWLDHNEDVLPEWLDVISNLFVNLEHFSLSEDLVPEGEMAVSARMRRLYVLYRLPDLKSIDDMLVTKDERKMARPKSPSKEEAAYVRPTDCLEKKPSLLDMTSEEDNKENHNAPAKCPDVMQQNKTDAKPTEIRSVASPMSPSSCTPRTPCSDANEESSEVEIEADEFIYMLGLGMTNLDPYLYSEEDSSSADSSEEDSSSTGSSDMDTPRSIPLSCGSIRSDAVEVNLSGEVQNTQSPTETHSPSKALAARERLPNLDIDERSANLTLHSQSPHPLAATDTYDLVSVASSHHEWSAGCGVLTFRGNRGCGPTLRFGLCGRSRKKVGSTVKPRQAARSDSSTKKPDDDTSVVPCPGVQRHQVVSESSSSKPKFFPAETKKRPVKRIGAVPVERSSPSSNVPTANQRNPPSESLSSPFPMQFRSKISQSSLDIVYSKPPPKNKEADIKKKKPRQEAIHKHVPTMETISSPRGIGIAQENSLSPKSAAKAKAAMKGDLPPPCPGGPNRSHREAKGSMETSSSWKARKARKLRKQQIKVAKATARTTSVLDDILDDEEVELCADDDLVTEMDMGDKYC